MHGIIQFLITRGGRTIGASRGAMTLIIVLAMIIGLAVSGINMQSTAGFFIGMAALVIFFSGRLFFGKGYWEPPKRDQ